MSNISPKNPLGIEAIDHLEFCTDSLNTATIDTLYKFGFEKTYIDPKMNAEVYSQGQVRFVVVAHPDQTHPSVKYFKAHGEGVSKISFLVENAEYALTEALRRGAELREPLTTIESEHGIYKFGCIQGFGDVLNEFIERPKAYFRPNFTKLETDPKARPLAQRFARIDHLTNNVAKGEMRRWVNFYKQIFGMEVTRYFDIKGQKTGLESEVVQLPNGSVIIPINEPAENNSKSQIQEFLDLHKGPGVQHIALMTADVITTVGDLQERGIKFLNIPSTYYQNIPKRSFKVDEDLAVLEKRQLLVDGDAEGYLLQNFTEAYVGPLFFETIQRKNHWGFGEGNFQALFDAIELDQMKRGYLK
ncbi:MAG: 4-hydroxyphenylpyruvate dioxygenase [Bacteriovorax sp.]|nr:4-hydroxyphenylpyruvate dioxygenase [Bacteriovorax sp.]